MRGARWIALCAIILTAGCGRGPRDVARRYLENLKQFNYEACYRMLSVQDRKDRSLQEFLTEIPLAPDVSPLWFRPVLHNTHYEVGAEHRNPDGVTAFVPVRVTAPDLPLWERTLDAAAGPDGSGSETAQRSLDTGDYPRRTYDDKFFFVKEHHHWHIVAGFGPRDRVIDRHREAMADYITQGCDKAIPEWQQMIADLELEKATGSLGLAAIYSNELAMIEKSRSRLAENTAYAAKLKLSGVAMKMSEERVPAIFGSITNSGDKGVDVVDLAVNWYEGRGKDLRMVHREEHPVVATPIVFTDFTRSVIPLLPGETRQFGFILTAPAQIQQAALPYVTIGRVTLTTSAAPLPKLHVLPASATGSPSKPAPPCDARQAHRAPSVETAQTRSSKPMAAATPPPAEPHS